MIFLSPSRLREGLGRAFFFSLGSRHRHPILSRESGRGLRTARSRSALRAAFAQADWDAYQRRQTPSSPRHRAGVDGKGMSAGVWLSLQHNELGYVRGCHGLRQFSAIKAGLLAHPCYKCIAPHGLEGEQANRVGTTGIELVEYVCSPWATIVRCDDDPAKIRQGKHALGPHVVTCDDILLGNAHTPPIQRRRGTQEPIAQPAQHSLAHPRAAPRASTASS